MKRFLIICLTMAFAVVGLVTATPRANAHTPSGGATCNKLWAAMSNAPRDFSTTITLDLDGKVVKSDTRKGNWGIDYTEISQNGATHKWAYVVDGEGTKYDKSDSGEIGPCGKPDQPPAETRHVSKESAPDCKTNKVTITTTYYETPYVWNGKKWVPGDERVVKTETSTREATAKECPPPPPPKIVHQTQWQKIKGEPNCEVHLITISVQQRTREGKKYADGKIVWGNWSDWVTVRTFTKPTTAEQCPPPPTDTPVTPPAPVWHDTCGPDNDGWTYTDAEGYAYTVVRADGVSTITVAPKPGYVFPEGTKTVWTNEIDDTACPPAPTPVNDSQTRTIDGPKDCAATAVTVYTQTRTRKGTKTGDQEPVWGPWSAWVTTKTSTRPATASECPPPPKPVKDRQTRTTAGATDCSADTVTTKDQARTRKGTQVPGQIPVWGAWTEWKTYDTDTRAATDRECPPLAPPSKPETPRDTTTLAATGAGAGLGLEAGIAGLLVMAGVGTLIAARRSRGRI